MTTVDKKMAKDGSQGTKKRAVEDEEFEEFPVQEWSEKNEVDEEKSVWEDNWDEETHETPFSRQLREELDRHGHAV